MSFFQTQLRQVFDGLGIDTSGRRLIFVGSLPVEAGDYVWTDGTVIFGNVSKKTLSPMIAEKAGIPVHGGVGEWFLEDDPEQFRVGYCKSSGTFKDYNIVRGDWIVNDGENIRAGDETFEEQKVLDAELGEEGELFLVTDGRYRENQVRRYTNNLYLRRYRCPATLGDAFSEFSVGTSDGRPTFACLVYTYAYNGSTVAFGLDPAQELPPELCNADRDIKFFRNGEQIGSFNLKSFADAAAELAWTIEPKIMANTSTDTAAINLTQQPAPPEAFIAMKYARVISMHVSKNGDWDAIISASAYGYCFPYLSLKASIFFASFPNDEYKTFSDELERCMNIFDEVVEEGWYDTLTFELYPPFTGDKKDDNGDWTEEYKAYVLQKAAFSVPRARFTYKVWYPILFNSFIVTRVHNGEIVEVIQSNAGGGLTVELRELEWDEKHLEPESVFTDFVAESAPPLKKEWTFPLDDEFYFRADGIRIKSIFARDGDEKILDIAPATAQTLHGVYYFYETSFIFPTRFVYPKTADSSNTDSRAQHFASAMSTPLNSVFNRYILRPMPMYHIALADYTEDEAGGYFKDYSNVYLDAWYRWGPDHFPLSESLGLQHVFVKLRGGACLLGIHGGNLIKINADGTVDVILHDLKNFRLHEMRKITRAKDRSQ